MSRDEQVRAISMRDPKEIPHAIELWFFADLGETQRRQLINWCGFPGVAANGEDFQRKYLRAIIEALRGASGGGADDVAMERLRIMSKQKLASEMEDHEIDCADWRGGYECLVNEARAVFASIAPDHPAENAKSSGEVQAAAQALVEALAKVSPITTRDTPDYAEVQFGDHQTQAMTMAPEDWQAIENTYLDLRAALARSGKGEG
jgi:hypothetical protein